jgi:lipoprotein-anchoring transpeptidase ErfK/SrfK
VDGLGGENTRQAIAAFEAASGLPVDGQLDAQVFERLTSADGAPVLVRHTISAGDIAHVVGDIPEELSDKARMESLGYASAREALAEKFHMDEDLLAALNPGVDFSRAGAAITVAAVADRPLAAEVARIEVDKNERAVKAYAADGALLAFYPASIGSSDNPAPSGNLTVTAIAPEPTYTYDPSRLSFGDGGPKVTIPAGPNSPVGSVWIDLSKDTYGIHGTDEPSTIGKAFSHGCVRLTNWNAEQLAAAVKAGVAVRFI